MKQIKSPMFFQHLHSKEECFSSFDLNCFSILDSATAKYQIKLKERMCIDQEQAQFKQTKKPYVYYFINLINFYGLSFFLFIFKFMAIILIAFTIVYFV